MGAEHMARDPKRSRVASWSTIVYPLAILEAIFRDRQSGKMDQLELEGVRLLSFGESHKSRLYSL